MDRLFGGLNFKVSKGSGWSSKRPKNDSKASSSYPSGSGSSGQSRRRDDGGQRPTRLFAQADHHGQPDVIFQGVRQGGRAMERPGQLHPPPRDTAGGEGIFSPIFGGGGGDDDDHHGWLYCALLPLLVFVLAVFWVFTHRPGGMLEYHESTLPFHAIVIGFLLLAASTVILGVLAQRRQRMEQDLRFKRNMTIGGFAVVAAVCCFAVFSRHPGEGEEFHYTTERMYVFKIAGLGFLVFCVLLNVLLYLKWHQFHHGGWTFHHHHQPGPPGQPGATEEFPKCPRCPGP